MLLQRHQPSAGRSLKVDLEGQPIAAAVHMPAAHPVAFNSKELNEDYVYVGADPLRNRLGDVESSDAREGSHASTYDCSRRWGSQYLLSVVGRVPSGRFESASTAVGNVTTSWHAINRRQRNRHRPVLD
jgi:hypothetical protein